MGLFKKSKPQAPVSNDPVVTYHISQNLSGKLNVTSQPPSYHTYSITLNKPKSFRETIDVAIHRSINSNYQTSSDVVGHCLIQVAAGKFEQCRFDSIGSDVKFEREGSNYNLNKASYVLQVPNRPSLRWAHDLDSVGGHTSSDRRLKLVEEQSKEVVARFAGASSGISEFGLLEVYNQQLAGDQEFCGLVILTAVCAYAREERSREKRKKANSVAGAVGNWGGLLTMGVPVGGS